MRTAQVDEQPLCAHGLVAAGEQPIFQGEERRARPVRLSAPGREDRLLFDESATRIVVQQESEIAARIGPCHSCAHNDPAYTQPETVMGAVSLFVPTMRHQR